MFKKNTWIVGLIAALAIMFVGCVDPVAEDTGGEVVEVVNLQSILANAPVGVIADDAAFSAIFGTSAFVKCGNPPLEIINDGGVKKLKIGKAMANGWGEGIDITFAKAGFKAGDELSIKGTAETGKNGVMLNGKGGAYYRIADWNSNDDNGVFDKTFTLTGEDITAIKTGSPQVIRIHYGPNDGDARKGDIILEQIVLKGLRGGGPVCDCESDCGECGMDGCGPQCSENAPDKFAASGTPATYKKPADPADAPNEFFLNLGDFTSDTMLGSGPDATLKVPVVAYSENSVKFYFDRTDQRVSFNFTPAQKALVKEAVDQGEPFKVEIVGTASPDAPVRYFVTNPASGSSYNSTNTVGNGKLSTLLNQTLTPSSNKADANTTAFTIQLREGPWFGVIVEIKSIKFIMPVLQTVNLTDLTITAPVPGEKPQTSLAETSQFTGSISWAPNDKNFEVEKEYTATVNLTTKNIFWTFENFKGTFTAGSLTASEQTVTAADSATVKFKYPKTTVGGSFPGGTGIKPQVYNTATPPVLVDLTDTVKGADGTPYEPADTKDGIVDVLFGTEITATYTKDTNGPIESSLTYRWQLNTGSTANPVWETKGEGKKFKPAAAGTWRILISTPFYEPLPSDNFNVYMVVKDIDITVAGATQKVKLLAVNGVALNTEDEKGYTFTKSAAWGAAAAFFKVTLGAGESISDYKTIKFTITGSGDDYTYKNLALLASDNAFTKGIESSDENTYLSSGGWGVDQYSSGTNELTLDLTKNMVIYTSTSNTPYISIYVHANVNAIYTISNIVLAK